jgi:hypothetical protein
MVKKRKTFKEFLHEFYSTKVQYKIKQNGNKIILMFDTPEDLLRFDASEIQNKSKIGEIKYTATTIEYKVGE